MSIDVDTLENDGDLEQVWDYDKIHGKPKSVICEDLYYWQNGFYNGKYLIPYARETFYLTRREHAYPRNYYQKIVDAAKNGVFSEQISRNINNSILEAFLNNPLQNGTSMNECMDYAALFSINNGYICTIVDNFPDMPEMSEADLIKDGRLPYVYFRKPDTIEKYKVDQFGLLESITFCEGKKEINGVEVDYFKTWDYENWRTYYVKGEEEIQIDEKPHGLKKFPVNVTYFGNKRRIDDIEADPRFYALAIVNFALWNLDSECRDNILTNLFPILAGSGFGDLTSKIIGSHGLLDMPSPENTVYFVEPSTGTFSEGREAKKELVEAMLQLAEQAGVTGVQRAVSGESKAYDFYASATLKKEISLKMKVLDQWIVGQVADYLNIESYEYNPDYPQTFLPNEADEFTNRLDKLEMSGGIPEKMRQFYLKKIAQQDMMGETTEDIEEVMTSIENEPNTLPE